MDEFYPIGSIVHLKNNRNYMIIGYLPSKPKDVELYDYICCENRVGVLRKKKDVKVNKDIFYVKKEDIENVLFMGYQGKEYDLFEQYLKESYHSFITMKNGNKEFSPEEYCKVFLSSCEKIINSGSDSDEK